MDLGLENKNVVITGASKGIGRATALNFADEGANVAVCARGQEALDKIAAELEALGVKAYATACDVSNADSLKGFLQSAKDTLGSIDILVNNASALSSEDDADAWKSSIEIDLMSTVTATQTVIPWMTENGGGAIVHVSTISALDVPGPPAYSATKAAVMNHSKNMAAILAPQNIRVNCVAPGSIYVEGGIWSIIKENDEAFYNGVVSQIPSGRMGKPEEVADAIVYLSSSRASWVSGSTLVVDGVQHKGIF